MNCRFFFSAAEKIVNIKKVDAATENRCGRGAGWDENYEFLGIFSAILKIVNSKKIDAAAKIDAREDEKLVSFFTWPNNSMPEES